MDFLYMIVFYLALGLIFSLPALALSRLRKIRHYYYQSRRSRWVVFVVLGGLSGFLGHMSMGYLVAYAKVEFPFITSHGSIAPALVEEHHNSIVLEMWLQDVLPLPQPCFTSVETVCALAHSISDCGGFRCSDGQYRDASDANVQISHGQQLISAHTFKDKLGRMSTPFILGELPAWMLTILIIWWMNPYQSEYGILLYKKKQGG